MRKTRAYGMNRHIFIFRINSLVAPLFFPYASPDEMKRKFVVLCFINRFTKENKRNTHSFHLFRCRTDSMQFIILFVLTFAKNLTFSFLQRFSLSCTRNQTQQVARAEESIPFCCIHA